jgi:hypothetical protein
MKQLATAFAVVAIGALTASCVTTRAQPPAARMPALEVPPVPPRVIEPVPPPPAPTLEPVGDLPAAPQTSTVKPRPQPRETQKPEQKPAETVAAEQPPVAAAMPPPPTVPPLRTNRTADAVQAERQIREIIGRANGLLGRVNYQKLSADQQKAHNQAKQFIEGAEAAIRDAKFEYALELAEKAETLAKELQG